MIHMTNEEKLIKFLNKKFQNSKTNEVSANRRELPEIGLTEQEVIQSIYLLNEDDLLDITHKSVHDDLSMFWKLSLKSSCVHYFENKQLNSIANRRGWVQTYIPNIISVIAIAISIIALIISLFQKV